MTKEKKLKAKDYCNRYNTYNNTEHGVNRPKTVYKVINYIEMFMMSQMIGDLFTSGTG